MSFYDLSPHWLMDDSISRDIYLLLPWQHACAHLSSNFAYDGLPLERVILRRESFRSLVIQSDPSLGLRQKCTSDVSNRLKDRLLPQSRSAVRPHERDLSASIETIQRN